MEPINLEDKPHEECGVFALYAPGRDVARLSFFGLYALQHRGQESAGIVTSDGQSAFMHKDMGLVSQVFKEDNLRHLRGSHAIGHTRYSTTGSSHVKNAQPYLIETLHGHLSVAHNGNLTNAQKLRQRILERGGGLSSTSDSEVLTYMLALPTQLSPMEWNRVKREDGSRIAGSDLDFWQSQLISFMLEAEGAYTLGVLTRDAVYGVRDPQGLRPLCLGQLEDGHYVLASESCALNTIGAVLLREIEPGEIVRLDANGVTSLRLETRKQRALCSFEFVYFARPDSVLEHSVVHDVRQRIGGRLAQEAPVAADIVVAVPDSATPHGIGYAAESGLPYTEGLIKNRYIGRTFIQPDQSLRDIGMQLKYNPLRANLEGKRVVLIDDSIVRGTTAGPLVKLLRDAGAVEVHLRVACPPILHPCFMGVDMATRAQLIAHDRTWEEIRALIGADSLAYISVEGLRAAITDSDRPADDTGHCYACMTGQYPLDIPAWLFREDRDKNVFEDAESRAQSANRKSLEVRSPVSARGLV
jgi:amidophosphoribosyltransferase